MNLFKDTLVEGVLSVEDQDVTTVAALDSDANVDTFSTGQIKFFRLGDLLVYVFSCQIVPNAADTWTWLRFDPPLPSAFSNSRHLIGVGGIEDETDREYGAAVSVSYGTDDLIEVRCRPQSTNAHRLNVVGVYELLS